MNKSLRLSEKWFRRGLWLVALVFASFLIGLGGTLISNLPKVERSYTLEDFEARPAAQQARDAIKLAQDNARAANDVLAQAELKFQVAQSNSRTAQDTFSNWLSTRHATMRSDQDQELIARTRTLDDIKAAERRARALVEAQQQAALNARQGQEAAQRQLNEIQQEAGKKLQSARRSQELRVFLYRLALTLPLLVLAGWLFARKRKSTYWPFVWGFIFFALFAFFVELVPYLPSYGGYVRYITGIIITALVGRQTIIALNRYLEKQKLAEQQPDVARREELNYDTAFARLAKGVCPGCERVVKLDNQANGFCPHCGITLHDNCPQCQARKSAFARFCFSCGAPAASGMK
ncbi:MAG TPA: serine endopeptidase [Oxalobacteraceae bacterium]|nr:serine endopeptidase [Oxalobacteraceae bacterium]